MERHVVKFGSDLIADQDGIRTREIQGYVKELAHIDELIIVTSGAVKVGEWLFKNKNGYELEREKDNLKFLAGLGCTAVFNAFEEEFRNNNRLVASYPITHMQLDKNKEFIDAVNYNFKMKTAIIINEADAFNQRELMKLLTGGDNDGLASHVAVAFDADELTIFTESGGIYDDDGKLIEIVDNSNRYDIEQLIQNRNGSKSGAGRGGIQTKFNACCYSMDNGVTSKISAVGNGLEGRDVTRFVVG